MEDSELEVGEAYSEGVHQVFVQDEAVALSVAALEAESVAVAESVEVEVGMLCCDVQP